MKDSTFLGRRIYQTNRALPFWEKLLSSFDFKRIIDLGTANGNFSVFFLLTCLQRKADFHTFDNIDWRKRDTRPQLKNFLGFDRFFKKVDIMEYEKEIGHLIQSKGRTIVYCDNGNKKEEIRIFSKYMKEGDIVAVHDWMFEIFPKDIPSGLKEVFINESNEEGMTKVFQK